MLQGNPYPYEVIIDRIRTALRTYEITQVEVATAIGIRPGQFSDKMLSRQNRFTVQELGDIAAVLKERSGSPLTCWPWVSLERATWLDAIRMGVPGEW